MTDRFKMKMPLNRLTRTSSTDHGLKGPKDVLDSLASKEAGSHRSVKKEERKRRRKKTIQLKRKPSLDPMASNGDHPTPLSWMTTTTTV